jgi:tRNA-2-methylthio-N6-dimethylallyladenosine synthase
MRRVEFVQAFVFKYSNRPGTAADRVMPDDVPPEVKARRNRELLALQEEIQHRRHRELVGTVQEVLVEGPSKRRPELLTGRTSANRIVHFPGGTEQVGRLVPVRITGCTPLTLSGEVRAAP